MRRRDNCALPRRAANCLKRIAVLTGAKRVYGDCYLVAARGRRFLVDYKFVRAVSRRGKSTCFSIATVPDMPKEEVVASALLQLKSRITSGQSHSLRAKCSALPVISDRSAQHRLPGMKRAGIRSEHGSTRVKCMWNQPHEISTQIAQHDSEVLAH